MFTHFIPPVASLFLGFILGYLGQRSRFCFIGGMRDWWLVRDVYLLKGFFAFIFSAFLGFLLFHFFSDSISNTFPWFLKGGSMFLRKWHILGIDAILQGRRCLFNPINRGGNFCDNWDSVVYRWIDAERTGKDGEGVTNQKQRKRSLKIKK